MCSMLSNRAFTKHMGMEQTGFEVMRRMRMMMDEVYVGMIYQRPDGCAIFLKKRVQGRSGRAGFDVLSHMTCS